MHLISLGREFQAEGAAYKNERNAAVVMRLLTIYLSKAYIPISITHEADLGQRLPSLVDAGLNAEATVKSCCVEIIFSHGKLLA